MLIKLLAILLGLSVQGFANSYQTNFPNTEVPLSEGGNWIQGGVVGKSWANVNSQPQFAYGTQTGASGGSKYNDSTAVLSGSWSSDQSCEGTIAIRNAGTVFEECELRLRTTITSGSITGYEFIFSVSNNSNNYYVQIVRWNGPLGNFTFLDGRTYHVANGDVVKATAVGNTLTLYVDGVARFSVQDSTYKGGSPGIGFYLDGGTGLSGNYGFSAFSASDSGSAGPTPTPYKKWHNRHAGFIQSNPANPN